MNASVEFAQNLAPIARIVFPGIFAVEKQADGQRLLARHAFAEKTQAAVGALVVDFGHNEVRVIYVAFILAARGFGYGKAVLRGVQQAAAKVQCPVAVVVWHNNPGARRIYLELGFQVEESQLMADRMVWYPGKPG